MKKFDSYPRKQNLNIEPKLTVIVAVYNIESYLKRCIDSILNQSYQNIQLILVDDGSLDLSSSICDEYVKMDSRVQVIHKKNGGLSDARNAGMKIADGEYIAFVDGDDWIDSDMYKDLIGNMLLQNADMGICRYRTITGKKIGDDSREFMMVFEGQEALSCLIEEDDDIMIQNAAWNKVYKRSLITDSQYGTPLCFPKGKWYEDILYTTQLLSRIERCVYLDHAYYNYVKGREDSIMSQGINERILTDQIPTYYQRTAFLRQIGRDDLADIHAYYFYKRLLTYYTQFARSKAPNKKEYCKRIATLIHNDRNQLPAAFQTSKSSANEKKKMDIFLASTTLYKIVMKLNDTIIIPYKIKRNLKQKPLLIVQLSGGIGNQMFQYALYLQLLKMGKNVKIDDITEYEREDSRPIQLQIFGINYLRASNEEIVYMTDSYMDLFSRLRRKLTGRRTKKYVEGSKKFDPNVFTFTNRYLIGCWQSEQYFKEIREDLIEKFDFSNIPFSPYVESMLKQIKQDDHSVSIHIRRGDYLNVPELYGGICDDAYYERAIRFMKEQDKESHFYVFSNDYEWCEKHFKGNEFTVVQNSSEDTGYTDMLLMSQCRHNIIANSSFSWWAAWLNQNREKCVIAPQKWLNGFDCDDVYFEGIQKV